MKDYKEESKKSWGTESEGVTMEQLNLGAVLRIADATEAMAKNYNELIRERDNYKAWYLSERRDAAKLERSNATLRGHITRLKNKK